MEATKTYTVRETAVGHLTKWEAVAVDMPRERFLEILDDTITHMMPIHEGQLGWLREQLMPVARSMPHFPLGKWFDRDRGCGCLVGEYLVAAKELEGIRRSEDENDWRTFIGGRVESHDDIRDLLHSNYPAPQADALVSIGNKIDSMLRKEIEDVGISDPEGLVSGNDYPGDPEDVEVIVFT